MVSESVGEPYENEYRITESEVRELRVQASWLMSKERRGIVIDILMGVMEREIKK